MEHNPVTLLTMNKRTVEPLDIVTVGIHNHDLIAKNRHWKEKYCAQGHCEGEITQPKPKM